MKQEDASDDQMTRFSEMTTTSSMYTTRRLRLLGQSAHESELMRWSQSIQPIRKRLTPPPQTAILPGMSTPVRAAALAAARPAAPAPAPAAADSIRVVCNKCQAPMRIPLAVLRGKPSLNVRCPNCKNIFTLRPKPAAQPPGPATAQANPSSPPVSSSAPAKPASQPPAPAAKAKPAVAPEPANARTKSPARPSVATAAHKQAR